MGAVSFIETMDHTSLSSITQEEFEKQGIDFLLMFGIMTFNFHRNVEDAIQALPLSDPNSPLIQHAGIEIREPFPPSSPHAGEESAQPLSLSTPAHTISEDAKRLLQKTGDTISKPLNAIGRIFSEALDGAEGRLSYLPGPFAPFELGREHHRQQSDPTNSPGGPRWIPQFDPGTGSPGLSSPQTPFTGNEPHTPPIQTPYKPRVRRVPSPSYSASPGSPGFSQEDTPTKVAPYTNLSLTTGSSPQQLIPPSLLPPRVQSLVGSSGAESVSRTPTPGLNLSEIEAQIDAAHENATTASRETLVQIFPGVDLEVVEWVLEANGGDLGKSIEALLEMSSGS